MCPTKHCETYSGTVNKGKMSVRWQGTDEGWNSKHVAYTWSVFILIACMLIHFSYNLLTWFPLNPFLQSTTHHSHCTYTQNPYYMAKKGGKKFNLSSEDLCFHCSTAWPYKSIIHSIMEYSGPSNVARPNKKNASLFQSPTFIMFVEEKFLIP